MTSFHRYHRWKPRLFIVVGGYLYRFSDEYSDSPKGVPIPLESCAFRVLEGNETTGYMFLVSTLRKEYVLRADTSEERREWITALRDAKQLAIKVRLGHATMNPQHHAANKAGDALFKKRLQEDADAPQNMELELLSGMPSSSAGF